MDGEEFSVEEDFFHNQNFKSEAGNCCLLPIGFI
jgi:hypothetical protein